MRRRQFITTGTVGLLASHPLFADSTQSAGDGSQPHTFDRVRELARYRATRTDSPATMNLSGPFANLNYDRYRGIRFRKDHNPLNATSDFSIDLLPPGMLYKDRVDIYVVRDGTATRIDFNPDAFDFQPDLFDHTPLQLSEEARQQLGWTGFRIRYPINNPDVGDEIVVFQGASYFRAIARNTLYGLSARGLAIKTGNPKGEEFPRFTAFWIYQPKPGARTIHIEALLESDSLTGAYAFDITPGAETVFVINCSLFPRRIIEDFGIAPLTSMYYFSPTAHVQANDYRAAVHDSEGLEMVTGGNIRLWRPLSNPPTLQFSAFQDNNPKGFGLIQRNRQFSAYQDDEAHYESRPSAWIIPRGAWGKGNVSLIEIPVTNEFNDNIVCFWKPDTALKAGKRTDIAYDLIWSADGPPFNHCARVISTRSGRTVNQDKSITFAVDFAPYKRTQVLDPKQLTLNVSASKGQIRDSALSLLDNGLLRATFHFFPGEAKLSELQLSIRQHNEQIAESWLYRWVGK